MMNRNEKLLHCIDLVNQIGVEVGPLDKPIVTRKMGKVLYIDRGTTAALRHKYALDANVDTDKIVDVDYVWGEKSLVDLTQAQAPFDYVIASHVIEHVPDFIGWLGEVRSILKTGGILSLAIPDKRRCFDYERYPTKLAEVIDAYLHCRKKPSPQQIFDYFSSFVSFRGSIAWGATVNTDELIRIHSVAEAWDNAKTAFTEDEYCDVHCWVFTPASFFSLLSNLTMMDLLKFEVAQFYESEGCEFHVSLRACDKPSPTKIAELADSLVKKASFPARKASSPSLMLPELQLLQLLPELQLLQQRIEAMESSKFWKIRTAWFKIKQKIGLSSYKA